MRIRRNAIFVIIFLLTQISLNAQHESYYSKLIQKELGGELEAVVVNGFVDLLTDENAYEIEFASKWKQSIGQALWYGLQTNKKPGIVLILRNKADFKYVQQLYTALDYNESREGFSVLIYPIDFDAENIEEEYLSENKGKYWLSTNSNKRHNHTCRWFKKSKGKLCSKLDGTPGGCCKG